MSNTQAPIGFLQTRRIDGAEPNYATNNYQILYTQSDKIGTGDPVITSAGYIDKWASGVVMGIFQGCEYTDSVNGYTYQKAWTAPTTAVAPVYATICDDPNTVFRVQVGGTSTTGVTQSQIGLNASPAGVGAPSATGLSVAYLDYTTVSTTSTLPFRIVGFGTLPTDDATSAYNWVQVVMNSQVYKVGTTGA